MAALSASCVAKTGCVPSSAKLNTSEAQLRVWFSPTHDGGMTALSSESPPYVEADVTGLGKPIILGGKSLDEGFEIAMGRQRDAEAERVQGPSRPGI